MLLDPAATCCLWAGRFAGGFCEEEAGRLRPFNKASRSRAMAQMGLVGKWMSSLQ